MARHVPDPLGCCSGCVLRGLLRLQCPVATGSTHELQRPSPQMHSQWRLGLLGALQHPWVSRPGRRVGRPVWVLEQGWSSVGCLGGSGSGWGVRGNRKWLGGRGQLRGRGGWSGVTLDGALGRQNGGGEAHLFPPWVSGWWPGCLRNLGEDSISCLLSPSPELHPLGSKLCGLCGLVI